MENRVEKLFSLLSCNNSFLRNRSALQVAELAAENSTNIPVYFNKIRKDILKRPDSTWESRIAAATAIYEIIKSCPVPFYTSSTTVKVDYDSDFDIDVVLSSVLILAGSLGDKYKTGGDAFCPKSSKERSNLNEQLEINPLTKLDTKEWVSDEDLLSKDSDLIEFKPLLPSELSDQKINKWEKCLLIPNDDLESAILAMFQLCLLDLFDSEWTIRHGAALTLKVLAQTSNSIIIDRFSLTEVNSVLKCMVCDRFDDYLGQHVVAPVRESCAQVLGIFFAKSSLLDAKIHLLKMIEKFLQYQNRKCDDTDKNKFWRCIHNGLLLIKYIMPNLIRDTDLLKTCAKELFESLIDLICCCLEYRNEDVINVACECFECCLSRLIEIVPEFSLTLIDHAWHCLYDQAKMDDLAECQYLGEILKIISIVAQHESQHVTAEHLSVLIRFLRVTTSTEVFKAVVAYLKASADAFGIEEWTSSGVMHVMRALYARCLMRGWKNPDENRLNFDLWSFLLNQQSIDSVTRPLSAFFDQWFATVIVSDTQPQIDPNLALELFGDAKIKNNGLFFLGGDSLTSLCEMECYFAVSTTKLNAAKFLAVLCSSIIENKISPVDDINQQNYEWILQSIALHLSSTSLTRKTIAYMVILNLSENSRKNETVCRTLKSYFYDTINDPNVKNSVFDETVPILAELNKLNGEFVTQMVCNGVSGVKSLAESAGLENFILNSFNAQSLVSGWLQYEENVKQLVSQVSDHDPMQKDELLMDFQNFLSQIKCYTDDVIRLESRFYGWVSSCSIWNENLALPEKLNQLIGNLMQILKREVFNEDFPSPVLSKVQNALCELIFRLIGENRSNVAEKLAKNLILLLANPAIEMMKQEIKDLHNILNWQNRLMNLDDDEMVLPSAILCDTASENCGKVLQEIIRRAGKNVEEKLPNVWQILLNLNLSREKRDELAIALQVFETIAPALDDSLLTRLITFHVNTILAVLSEESGILRHLSSRLIFQIAKLSPNLFSEHFLCPLSQMIENRSNDDENTRFGVLDTILLILQNNLHIFGLASLTALSLLGQMSDQDECIRLVASACFGQMVKILPLEAKVDFTKSPNLPGNVQSLLLERRQFLMLLSQPEALIKSFNQWFSGNMGNVPVLANLRHYQKEGVAWLLFLQKFNLHGILCDDMGLGKTLQTLCCLACGYKKLEEKTIRRPSLIVCPKTLVDHWMNEMGKFFPLDILLPKNLESCNTSTNLHYSAGRTDPEKVNYVCVISYETLRRSADTFFEQKFWYCVLDEGHMIRNPKSSTSQAVMRLRCDYRLVLSGTPIQNSVLELKALFDFLIPGYLGDKRQFNKLYGKAAQVINAKDSDRDAELRQKALSSLHQMVLPFVLRRRKCDVLQELPPKIVQDVYCSLTKLQTELYTDFVKQVADSDIQDNNKPGTTTSKKNPLQVLTYLRKLCDHPSLVLDPSDQQYGMLMKTLHRNHDAKSILDYNLSGKMIALRQLLNECGIGGGNDDISDDKDMDSCLTTTPHRALIFCQFRSVVELLCNYLDTGQFGSLSYVRLDGSVAVSERQKLVDNFNADPSIDLMILTTSVGGLGLNLTGADIVIFVDHDWNPAKDLQAMDRAHRIGQKRTVNVYRLITKETLEEKIMRYQELKTETSSTIISSQNESLRSMRTDQLMDLLNNCKVPPRRDINVVVNRKTSETTASKAKPKKRARLSCDLSLAQAEKSNNGSIDLPDLWDQSQYDDAFDLASFMKTV